MILIDLPQHANCTPLTKGIRDNGASLFSTVRNLVVKQPIFPTLEDWLVNHRKIREFSWNNGQTPASSQRFLISFTFLLSQVSRPTLARPVLKSISAVHNIFFITLSFIMALGSLVSIFSLVPNFKTLICFPNPTSQPGPLFFWGYIFYLSKIVEFVDTLLIILSNSMKRRLSFLHVYHHSMAVIMSYMCVNAAQSPFSILLVLNCAVHVIMYTYYFMCTIGVPPRWTKMVTDCQLVQFWASFMIMAMVVFYHFTDPGCSGTLSWCFNSVFIVSLLFLFSDFHAKNYSPKVKAKYA